MRQSNNKNSSKKAMRFIGITGGIGAGKSEILRYVGRHYRCEIHLADKVAHQIMEPGQPCYEKLVELLGKGVLDLDGRIDRNLMAVRVFTDAGLLCKCNEIIHPAVQKYLMDALERARKAQSIELFFVEAALLIEAGYKDIVDELWYVYASPDTREQRLRENRGYSREKTADIMAQQLDDEVFRRECDFMIDNSTTLEEAYRQIDKKLEGYTWLN